MRSAPPGGENFSRYFAAGVAFRIGLSIAVMSAAYLGAAVLRPLGGQWAPLAGALLGLGAGVLVARSVKRRWDPLDRPPAS